MVELYRTEDCSFCDEIQARLDNLVVAHRVITLNPQVNEESTEKSNAPFLKMGDHVYDTPTAIHTFLDELEGELAFSRQISADACFLDPDDPDHCI